MYIYSSLDKCIIEPLKAWGHLLTWLLLGEDDRVCVLCVCVCVPPSGGCTHDVYLFNEMKRKSFCVFSKKTYE